MFEKSNATNPSHRFVGLNSCIKIKWSWRIFSQVCNGLEVSLNLRWSQSSWYLNLWHQVEESFPQSKEFCYKIDVTQKINTCQCSPQNSKNTHYLPAIQLQKQHFYLNLFFLMLLFFNLNIQTENLVGSIFKRFCVSYMLLITVSVFGCRVCMPWGISSLVKIAPGVHNLPPYWESHPSPPCPMSASQQLATATKVKLRLLL